MPCDTIQTNTVELGKAQPELLEAALNSLCLGARRGVGNVSHVIYFGRGEYYNSQTGELKVLATRDVAEIKRAYAHQVVQSQAKRFGWQIKQTAPNKYSVIRR